MGYENLRYATKERVGTITFNRPAVLHALNGRMLRELEAVLSEARENPEVGALILTGAGDKAFVAGADIQELAGHTPASGRDAALYGQSVFSKLERLVSRPSRPSTDLRWAAAANWRWRAPSGWPAAPQNWVSRK